MVLGGAASGKSDFAERFVIAQQSAPGEARHYIATAQAFDDEMRAKIDAHKAARADDGWTSREEPVALAEALQALSSGPVLIDCATLWLSNLVLGEHAIAPACDQLMDALGSHPGPVTIVTNEVGQGIVPEHALGRRFRSIQGRFNRQLAAEATLVIKITAGLPQVLKGQMP